jgi:hypothetical protein
MLFDIIISYEAAERLRNRCNFLQEHYLSDILSMVRVMVGELRWMKWIPTSSYAGRIEFSDANIRSFYRTLSQRQVLCGDCFFLL